jgi:hypothetical protein
MTARFKGLARRVLALGAVLAAGALGGLFIVWLKISYGVSPYWFIGAGTIFAILATAWTIRSVIKLRRPLFVFDWVVTCESIISLTAVSAFGLIALAALIWGGTILLVIGVALAALVAGIIGYVISHAPPTTWDD